MAEPVSRVAGGELSLLSAPASARVPSTLLARISALYLLVQRWSITPAPARCTQASSPSSRSRAAGSDELDEVSLASAACGSQRISAAHRGGPRTSLTTPWPSARRVATRAGPLGPDEPVTATFPGSVARALARPRMLLLRAGSSPW